MLVEWQVEPGCVPMVIAGLLIEHPDFTALNTAGWAVPTYMIAVPRRGVCSLAWFAMLRHLPPEVASIGMLLVPIMGNRLRQLRRRRYPCSDAAQARDRVPSV
ncbi:hypothetical protein LMG27177_06590 [Paraburkholderia fynbosensis]|uniref:Uncharacterized protein n=1 Tax=Paraburkholderia fynbosensis TaxID=1200993 RepID=A0A6J5GYM8_9BURK|nr:hypothetical protein LMG27177_06590 [Paraburkholderia fynbosensis]